MHIALPAALLLAVFTAAAAEAPIPLWPNGVPGPKFVPGPEHDTTIAKDNLVAGKPLIRLGNVTKPSLTFYPASKQNNTGAAVLVFPGGGYSILALDLEGTEICSWLNSIGINAVLVKYRVPQPSGSVRHAAPLQDAERAIGMVRQHAAAWHLDSKRIGVLGFSAGGHLAALLSNQPDSRPDFAVLIYPAYLAYSGHRAADEEGKTLAPEFHVTAQTPPTFIVQTEDDPVHVENSLVYYRALKEAKVPAELHVFSTGGHGYGMRPTAKAVTTWPKLAEVWLKAR
ncbi:MAG TPA: alpha/beta hydrolase [Bryobacteraceae bacterium]|jgi:acetyl esterase/lipase